MSFRVWPCPAVSQSTVSVHRVFSLSKASSFCGCFHRTFQSLSIVLLGERAMSAMATDHPSDSFSDASLLAPSLNQPIAVEGSDPSLATVILPAPPPLGFIKLPLNKRPGDHAKRPLPSFIPHTDPSSTYATYIPNPSMTVTSSTGLSEPDLVRPKRGRAEKPPYVSQSL